MEMALTFNAVEFSTISRNAQPWVRSPQIAEALGYSQANRINDIYARHADEFTDEMTAVVKLPTEGGEQDVRIFSLRGCHLLAMFARTPVAKAFRRWVLDVLDRLDRERQTVTAGNRLADEPITPDQQCTLQAAVRAKIEALPGDKRSNRTLYPKAWGMFNNHFRLARYCQLPQSRMSEAVEYLTQLDLAPEKALPAAPEQPRVSVVSQTCNKQLRIAADVAQVIRQVESLKVDARRWNAPREFRRSAADTGRAEDRYEIQSDLYRACNAALSAAVAALCASAEVGKWA